MNLISFCKKYKLTALLRIILVSFLFFYTRNRQNSLLTYLPLVFAFIPICIDGLMDIWHKKISTEFFLIFATGIALLAHQTEAMTAVLLIMLIAKFVEQFIEEKTGRAIESLMKLIPTSVIRIDHHQEQLIPLEQVKPGMTIMVKTGAQISIDGTIVDGQASINESFLTGESALQEKTVGDIVFAGTFVTAGSIMVLVKKISSDTYFGKIGQLLAQAEQEKATIVNLANKAALIIVSCLIVFIALVWIITGNLTLVATLLVFGSPIELTLITPLAILAGTAAAFRCGILIKGSLALERFASVDTLIFDKTGTLTMGDPEVITIESAQPHISVVEILTLASMLEKRSGHVLAKAILKKAHSENINIPDPEEYESVDGHGVEAYYKGKRYLLGSKHFIEAPEHANIAIPPAFDKTDKRHGITYFYLACENNLFGIIGVQDVIRPDAQKTILTLKKNGIKNILLLSGDRQEVAQHIAQKLGIETFYGEVDPVQKLTVIKKLQQQGSLVAMVGDGINDAPALKQADVGIALGAMGMEPAIEAADIVLVSNDLQGIIFVYNLSKKIMRLIKQNIFFGFLAVHLLGIVLALFNAVTPIQAALFHALSDLIVLINSAWLIRFSMKKQ